MALKAKCGLMPIVFCLVAMCSWETIDAADQTMSMPGNGICQFSKKQIVENPLNCDQISSIEQWKKIWGNPLSIDTVVGPPEYESDKYHLLWFYLNYPFGQAIFIRQTDGEKLIFTTVHIWNGCKDCLKCGIAIGDSVNRIRRILSEPDSTVGDSLMQYSSEGAELRFFVKNDKVKEVLYIPFWE